MKCCGVAEIASALSGHVGDVVRAKIEFVQDKLKIVIGSVDIGEDVLAFVSAMKNGDTTSAGAAIGEVAMKLGVVGCDGKACGIVETILSSLSIFFKDFSSCKSEITNTINSFNTVISYAKAHDLEKAVAATTPPLSEVGVSVQQTGWPTV